MARFNAASSVTVIYAFSSLLWLLILSRYILVNSRQIYSLDFIQLASFLSGAKASSSMKREKSTEFRQYFPYSQIVLQNLPALGQILRQAGNSQEIYFPFLAEMI